MNRFLALLVSFCFVALGAVPPPTQPTMRTFNTIADMVAALPTVFGTNAIVLGYSSSGDGGGGIFWSQPELVTTTTNLGTLFRSTSYTNYIWHRNYVGPVNVRWFGATTIGDQTSRINDAYSVIAQDGGVLYFPAAPGGGSYKFNLTVTDNNIVIQGDASSALTSVGGTRVAPFDATKPVIQVGNDTGYAGGFQLKDISFDGPNGDSAIYFAGGAVSAEIHNVSVASSLAFTNIFKIKGGTVKECSLIKFYNCDTQLGNLPNARAYLIQMPTSGNKWTTAIYLIGCHISGAGASGSYALEVDGTSVNLVGCFLDLYDQHGIKLSNSASTNPNTIAPFVDGANYVLDSGSSSDILVNTWATTGFPEDNIRGHATIDGKIQFSDGSTTTVQWTGANDAQYQSVLSYPAIHGTLNLIDTSTMPFNGWNQTNEIYASGGYLNIRAKGSGIKLAQDTGPDITMTSARIGFTSSSSADRFDVYDTGNISLFPGNSTVLTQGTNTVYQQIWEASSNKKSEWKLDSSGATTLSSPTNLEFVTTSGSKFLAYDTGLTQITPQNGAFYVQYSGNPQIDIQNTSGGQTMALSLSGSDGRLHPPSGGTFNILKGDQSVTHLTMSDTGDWKLNTLGATIAIKTGSNAAAGTVTLTNGQATVFTTALDANSIVFATIQAPSGTFGGIAVTNKVTSTSFEIRSSSATDASVVGWWIMDTQ